MSNHFLGVALIAVIYLCILIVLFSPSLYAGWLYVMSRYAKVKRAGLARVAITTFAINTILVVFLSQFAFNYFLVHKVAESDAAAAQALQKAVVSQEHFFTTHGRYYPVGPVRGPYHDDNGLTVEKDIILQVEPHWDKVSHKETFKAYALHILGKDLAVRTEDGKVEKAPPNSDQSVAIRSKLMHSVK